MSPISKDEFVITALDNARGMLKNLACRYDIDDWQDLQQTAAIDLLAQWRRIEAARNPIAYAHTVIRTAAFQYIRGHVRSFDHISLDDPVQEESDTPFSELLEASAAEEDHAAQDAKAAIMHQALHKLPLEEQLFMREVHSLNAFDPVLPRLQDGSYRKPDYNRSRHNLSTSAYRHLRADQVLAQSIMVS